MPDGEPTKMNFDLLYNPYFKASSPREMNVS